jgi:pimeloyl-ACP methyl ester carboxylesterase
VETIRAGGRSLEVLRHGEGPPRIVLLHEGLGCAAAWRAFPDELARRTGMGVVAFSRAGYGASDPIDLPRPLSYMEEEGERVLPEVLEALGVRAPILVGHSDGASIAIAYAGTHRGARALVLEAPHVFCEDLSVASIRRAKEAYEKGDLRARLARRHGANVDLAFRGWNDAWLDPRFRAWNIERYLPRIDAPILVVQGADDEYGTLAQVDAIAHGAGAPVERVILPACGHAPHKDQPEATLDAIERFLSASSARRA